MLARTRKRWRSWTSDRGKGSGAWWHAEFSACDTARRAGLDEESVQALVLIDRDGLRLAAESYASKRAAHSQKRGRKGRLTGLLRLLHLQRGRWANRPW